MAHITCRVFPTRACLLNGSNALAKVQLSHALGTLRSSASRRKKQQLTLFCEASDLQIVLLKRRRGMSPADIGMSRSRRELSVVSFKVNG